MVLIHDFRTGCLECLFANIVFEYMPEHIDADAGDAGAHRDNAEVSGLGYDRGE